MNIHEYQAKEILKKYGAQVPNGIVIFNIEELENKIKRLGDEGPKRVRFKKLIVD